MEKTKLKFRLIYLPFLLSLTACIVIYTFLNWLLRVKLRISINNDLAELFLPAILCLLLIVFLIHPRLNLLNIKRQKNKEIFRFLFYFALLFPVFIAQKCISQITGQLHTIDNIGQLDINNLSKYYFINNFSVDKEAVGHDVRFVEISRRRSMGSPRLSMKIFIIAPMYNQDNSRPSSSIMYCKSYERDVDGNLGDDGKLKEYQRFEKDALSQFLYNDQKPVTYFEHISETNSDYPYLYNAAQNIDNDNSSWIFLSPETKPFDGRYNTWLLAFIISLVIALSITWFMVSFAELDISKVEPHIHKK